ncbi:MAG: hypothetical protein IKE46_00510, partial [Selenomonadaceae bacterium]|nr:hypothetical protein [Selenomonadaceae bacterium]
TTQARKKFLFDEPKSFLLMPDILLEGDETIIMDTKWKREVSQADMYQMFAYAKKYSTQKIFLLCPPDESKNILYRTENLAVQIFHVDLFDINESITNLRDLML